jgi:cation diffusion facilitator family transporter
VIKLGAREHLIRKVALISVVCNIVLMIWKLIVGYFGHSDAVFADGIHSAADVVASVIVLFVLKIAHKPADAEHPYGHGKAEILVSAMIGIILLLISIYIIYEAIMGFFHPVEVPGLIALWTALISYASKHWLYRYSFSVAKEHKSHAIEAISLDHKADIFASIAAAMGVIFSIIGDKFTIGYLLYSDKVASIFVAYLIFKIAKEMLTESFDILLERNINTTTLREFEIVVMSFKDVRRIDRIRAREQGAYVLIDIRISIDYFKNIKEGHDLTREIRNKLEEKYDNISEVLIHLNPYFPENQ